MVYAGKIAVKKVISKPPVENADSGRGTLCVF